ncbi:MAG: hypothetical protein JNL42_18980 [Anaerolineae bacterium]|nr:hypothetical protein [Anaerolineae bacterium]
MAAAALRLTTIAQRFNAAWRSIFSPGDFYAWLIAAGLLIAPALSLYTAGWLVDLRTVLPIIVLSLIFGFLLARSQYNEFLCLIISAIYGTCFTLLIAAINQPGGFGEAIVQVFLRLSRWLYDAFTGGINQDDLVFTLLISGLFWFLGFNLVWHIFRIDRVWRAILPPALILITNQVYYTGPISVDLYLVVFLFLALLLLVRSALDAREWDWYVSQVRVPHKVHTQVYRIGVLFAALLLAAAWLIPQRDIQERLQRFQEFMQSETLIELAELWNRLFTSAEMQGPATSDYYGGDALQLGGAIRLGDQVVMLASAPPGRRYYWKSRAFDVYDAGTWKSAAEVRLTDPEAPLLVEHEAYVAGARVPVQQTFTFALNASQLIYAAPEVQSVDLATRTDLRFTPTENLVEQNMLISVIRPLRVLYRGDSYTATSLMSAATPDQLRGAGTNYPVWVRDLYSSYIPSVTERTIALANQIVGSAGAVTPYDQAVAIESWLRANIRYNELIPQPPLDRDSVDWFLFDLREGYCNYYASAMAVMLRSLGIPARLAAGFAQGTYDPDQRAYIVQERDAHTWVEVYFPGYGWIEFEPTAAQSAPQRGDDTSQNPPTAQPSPTATLTPTPLPSPTPTAQPTLPPPEGTVTPGLPTLTLTPIPSLTPSPVIVPTIPPQLPTTPSASPLGFLLPIVAAVFILLVLALIILLALALLYWWWEWRGMRGLSPVARAYARLERYAGLLGLRLDITNTPEERRLKFIRAIPRAEPPITAITSMYILERYGRRGRSKDRTPRGRTADKAWSDARGSILGRFLRGLLPWRRR